MFNSHKLLLPLKHKESIMEASEDGCCRLCWEERLIKGVKGPAA